MIFKTPKELLFKTNFDELDGPLFKNQNDLIETMLRKAPYKKRSEKGIKKKKYLQSVVSSTLSGNRKISTTFETHLTKAISDRFNDTEQAKQTTQEILKQLYLYRFVLIESPRLKKHGITEDDLINLFNKEQSDLTQTPKEKTKTKSLSMLTPS